MFGATNIGLILRRLFQNNGRRQPRRIYARRTARLGVEALESRHLLATLIMPLGASITAGYPSTTGGYRVPLLNLLSAGGFTVTDVGSQTTYNPSSQPNLQHEGHYGYTIGQIDAVVGGNVIQQYNPDIILLLVGTNNLLTDQNAPWVQTDYVPLLNDIFTAKPTVRVIVSSLFTASGVAASALDNFNIGNQVLDAQQHVVGYTGGLAQLVTAQQQLGRSISFDDGMRSYITSSDLVDGIHPTDAGYQKVAMSWYGAIQAGTPGQLTTVAPTGPTGLTATTVSATQVNVSWTRNSLTESAFKVDVSTSWDFSQGVTTLTAAAGSNRLSVTGLLPATPYYFRVRATNSYGNSPNSLAATATTWPPGWSAADIGSPGVAGSTSFDGTTWTIKGGGLDIWSAPDQFQYAYASVSGDATLVAKVTSLQNTSPWAKAGVMFRDGTASGAPYVAVLENPNNQLEMQWRDTVGTDSNWNGSQVGDTSHAKWLELVRSGNSFSAYYAITTGTPTSSDWVLIGSHTLAMAASTAGLAVTAQNNAALTTATFTNVSLTSGLPAAPVLAAAAAGTGQINLTWTESSTGVTGFLIERSTDGTNFTQIASLGATANSYSNTGLTPGTKYYYRARATSTPGNSSYSGVVNDFARGVATHFAVSVPATAAAGSPFSITVSALDQFNNTATGYTGTVHFSSSDSQAALPANYAFVAADLGVHTFNGVTLTTAGSQTVIATDTVSASITGTGTVSVSSIGPSGWSAADIGSPGLAGSTSFDGTTWTIKGGGLDIWSAPDQFQYAYASVSGDATLVAKVTSLQNTSAWAKAGVMFRDGTASGAPYVAVLENPNNQLEMQWRDTVGTDSNWNGSQVGDTSHAKWVELVRSGNNFSAYYAITTGTPTSSDWVLIGSHTLAMAPSTAGLAVTAQNNAALTTATFTNVSLTGRWLQTTVADFSAGTNSGTVVTNTSGGEVQLAASSLSGTFTSAIFDALRAVTWGTSSWTANVPTGTTLTAQTRSGNTPNPDGTWSAWAAVSNGQGVSSPGARYLQYRVTLTSTNSSLTPVLFDITLLWS